MDTNETGPAPTVDHDGQPGQQCDVVVVGGGTGGLGAALPLARARRSVLVIDAGSPRNAPSGHVHNYLGREGTPPLELLALARQEVSGYGAEVATDRVTHVGPLEGGGFVVERLDGPPVKARRLLVATGLVDELPDVEGLSDHWGTDVLHCPYCHGWEVRDHVLAVLATSPMSVHQALLWSQWTSHLTLVLHDGPDPDVEQAEQLAALDIEVVRGPAVAVETQEGRVGGIRLTDGRLVACQQIVVAARFDVRPELLDQLGLAPVDFVIGGHVLGTHVPTDATGATTVPGVWAVGNVTDPTESVIGAAAVALRAAHAINLDLITEDTRSAVDARRRTSHVAGRR